MERRRGAQTHSTPLPADYLKMVTEVFTSNFDSGLQSLASQSEGKPYFGVDGAVYSDEVVLCVSLLEEDQIAATTVYASADFDPKASAPTVQDLLAACVDAIGALYSQLLSAEHPEHIAQLASHSLSAMDGVPFHWSEVRLDRHRIHMKVDKSNPKLDAQADEWLRKNDPDLKKLEEQNEEDAKRLFVTGPKKGSGTVH